MAISIDNVYQKVLTLANKEQRGYVTPQEFNLLADKAQNDIFEMYFHEYQRALSGAGNQDRLADDVSMLKEKIRSHRVQGAALTSSNTVIPSDVHYLERMYYIDSGSNVILVEEVDSQESMLRTGGKVKPNATRPIFSRTSDTNVVISPAYTASAAKIDYIKKPTKPNWGYVVVNDKALYNSNTSTDFDLHASEESTLTNKILELAGIVINKPGLSEVILRNEAVKEANENR